MKHMLKNSVIGVIFFSLIYTPVSAIPGIQEVVPTESGQYVYYRDYSFTTETYIGFLQYDEGTYSVRYYAENPQAGTSEIELLISLDATQDYVLMTGERIIGNVTQADTDTLNYLHDIFYELASRRKKMNGSDFGGVKQSLASGSHNTVNTTLRSSEYYYQYGGDVVIEYDMIIPIFNVRSIVSATTASHASGDFLLQAVTMGQLTDSEDKSFADFKGITRLPAPPADENIAYAELDEAWAELQNNYFFLDNDALLYTYELEINRAPFENKEYTDLDYLVRSLSFAVAPNYMYLPAQSVYMQNGSLIISNIVYMGDTGRFSCDTKIITALSAQSDETNLYRLTSLTAFYDFYYHNESYFIKKTETFTE